MPDAPIEYPQIPDNLSGRFNWKMLQYFGAGAILASVTIGSGETLMASRGGSIFWLLRSVGRLAGVGCKGDSGLHSRPTHDSHRTASAGRLGSDHSCGSLVSAGAEFVVLPFSAVVSVVSTR